VVASRIHPVTVSQPELIIDLLEKMQDVLNGTPPPWLRKAMQKGQEREFVFDEEDAGHG
jgi:nitrogen fixation protein NifX